VWLGELLLENRLLQKELARLKIELEQIKMGLLSSSPIKQEEKGEKEGRDQE
jgi:hypothetical protein